MSGPSSKHGWRGSGSASCPGFASCTDAAGLQTICDQLGPDQIQAFFDRWTDLLPLPLDTADRTAGYWGELSMRQIETSRTMVFDQPRQARAFFTALVADNLDLGRPDHVELIFAGHPRRWGRPPKTEPTYKTRIDTRDTIGLTRAWGARRRAPRRRG